MTKSTSATYTRREWVKLCEAAEAYKMSSWHVFNGVEFYRGCEKLLHVWQERSGGYVVYCRDAAARRALGKLELKALGKTVWGIE